MRFSDSANGHRSVLNDNHITELHILKNFEVHLLAGFGISRGVFLSIRGEERD